MDPRLQDLIDHHEIRQLLCRYCQGSDRFDAERMAGVFHSASWVDHAHTHSPGPAFVEEAIPAQVAHVSLVWHQLGQSFITVAGDEATAETYLLVAYRGRGPDETLLTLMGGRFLDTLRRDEGLWKIAKRLQVRDWSYSHRVDQDTVAQAGFFEGSPSGDDPFYSFFCLAHSGPFAAHGDGP